MEFDTSLSLKLYIGAMINQQKQKRGLIQSTLHQQLLKSHLRVVGLAAIAFLLVAIAMQLLNRPISSIQAVNVPTANAAMTIQIGLQRSEANLRGWVALKEPSLRKNVDLAWEEEIIPAFASLKKLSNTQNSRERNIVLDSLDYKLKRLKNFQDVTISIADQPHNEPARLDYTKEYLPKQIKFLNDVEAVRIKLNHPGGKAKEGYLALHLAVSKAEAKLGLFVVDGKEADASEFRRRFARIRFALQYFEFIAPTAKSLMPQVNDLERISERIIKSRQSSKSNLAWHNISAYVTPLSTEIAEELAAIANYEVATMKNRVDQVATWTNLMSGGSLLALLILFAIALLLSSSAARRISTPVTKLYRATEELKNGNYEQRLQPDGVLEVQGLINAFNAMSASIMHSHQALEEIAYTDELTGLANRKAFSNSTQLFNQNVSQAHQYSGAMVIDLDYFKQVNDSMGHDAGDHLLVVFSQRLQQALGQENIAARIGGDEFAVLLSSLENEEEAKQLVKNIIKATSQPVIYLGQSIVPSATIGLAVDNSKKLNINELVKRADFALYDAKANGRGGYCFYSPDIHEKAMNTRVLAELIEHNDIEDMFRLVYQPYVNLSTEEFVGAEALLRCTHPLCAGLSILDVITMLERNGNIEAISRWVIKVAIAQLKQWRSIEGFSEEFTMSVNVSAALLRHDNFVQAVLDVVEESGIPGRSLMIEITETTVMEDYVRSRQAMQQLNEVGIEFAMDDFGTGHSSLLRLKEMPLSLLKIDQTFVKNMLNSTNDAAIVDASVRLGHAIGMTVIAEGIETAEQALALRKLGCERGQGYYFSMPLSPDEIDFSDQHRRFAA